MLFPNQSTWTVSLDKMVLLKLITKSKAKNFKVVLLAYREVNQLVITRLPKMCNFLDYKEYKIVYKRFASLYFITIVDKDQN